MEGLRVWLLILTVALTSACSGSPGSTSGKRVTLHTILQPELGAAAELAVGSGWTIRLTRARLALDALYYFDGAPAFAKRTPPPPRAPWQRLERWVVGVAHAHPQHYVPGNALGQMTTRAEVDLLAGAVALADGEGVTGTYRSARLVFDPSAAVLVEAQGVASKAEQVIHFALSVSADELRARSPALEIDGSAFEEVAVARAGTVTLSVDPGVWFNLVDFSGIDAGTTERPTPIPSGERAHTAFVLGVAQLSAYRYRYATDD